MGLLPIQLHAIAKLYKDNGNLNMCTAQRCYVERSYHHCTQDGCCTYLTSFFVCNSLTWSHDQGLEKSVLNIKGLVEKKSPQKTRSIPEFSNGQQSNLCWLFSYISFTCIIPQRTTGTAIDVRILPVRSYFLCQIQFWECITNSLFIIFLPGPDIMGAPSPRNPPLAFQGNYVNYG